MSKSKGNISSCIQGLPWCTPWLDIALRFCGQVGGEQKQVKKVKKRAAGCVDGLKVFVLLFPFYFVRSCVYTCSCACLVAPPPIIHTHTPPPTPPTTHHHQTLTHGQVLSFTPPTIIITSHSCASTHPTIPGTAINERIHPPPLPPFLHPLPHHLPPHPITVSSVAPPPL